ncbi:leucine-rich repeat and calponin homology domain-containing protein 1 isoform X2 [Ambystoma mexicanum]|uniref:leucine-rich repeat and calponin homology domain-containing protein 1 isoform X2 n=1 Tax=Ambystoma mexicanum TaxID=8296 RepID=UPI0037E74985
MALPGGGGEAHPFPAMPQYPQPPGAGAATGGGGCGGGASFGAHPPLNRALERVLEEAATSGALILTGRKLKELPRSSQSHDLSDTVQTDLSKNRLAEVPMEVCHFVSLEALNLYHNCIKCIPDAIGHLQMLTYLNVGRNQLSSLPACLCGLPLKVLIASNNKLGCLPEEIDQLQHLMELDVSCNEITLLPRQIGRLKSLRELNIRRNYIQDLPPELVELPLVKFDFSCNKVQVIPLCFRRMTQLQVLVLENNPLQSPPAQICTKGKVHIFKYLAMQACQIDKTTDPLYLHSIERAHLQQHVEESIEDIYPTKKDSDSGVGSDNGDKRLSAIEPSDEETTSLNVPMSNITEEDQTKDNPHHHLSPTKVEPHPQSPLLIDSGEEARLQCTDEADVPTSPFMNYSKGSPEDLDEPLQIEEDGHWPEEEIHHMPDQDICTPMIDELRKAVHLLQDPNRLSMEMEDLDGVNLYPLRSPTMPELHESTVNGQTELEMSPIFQDDFLLENEGDDSFPDKTEDSTPTTSPTANSTTPFGLKPRSVFLRPQRSLESVDPQFTMRRKLEQMREEKELMEHLRESIEGRLKICLPEDLGSALMDGVVLCHLVNHIRPRSVGSIHVPSPAVPKLSMAKCRRNVENFLDACRKMGVPEEKLCLPHHILEEKGLVKVSITVHALLDETVTKQALFI